MKIPRGEVEEFGAELITKCLSSRKERIPAYAGLRHYYLFGAQEGQQAPYNKLNAHLDLLTAFLYSQSTVEFDVSVHNQPPNVSQQAELLKNRLNINFHKNGISDAYGQGLKWSLVYNSMYLKVLPARGGRKINPYLVEPHNFGVLQEDVPDLDRQEAFVHCYRISQHEFDRRISVLPNAADLKRRATASTTNDQDAFPEPVNRMLIAGTVNMTNSTTRGVLNIPELIGQMHYRPRAIEDTVEMYELWVWDDDAEDYRTITMADPGILVYGSQVIGNVFGIKGRHPFIHICANPLYDYFYGWSELTNLLKLQDWITLRLMEIKNILSKQADPPKALSGFQGLQDEKIAALSTPGSWLSDATPNAKIELLAPDVSEDLFKEVMIIQGMFNDISGLSEVLQGKGEKGVRAAGHADVLAKLGSARIKQRALHVEANLEKVGELIMAIMRAKDPHRYKMDDGMPFVAAQFTEDHQVHVDAHSASPVFVDDHVNLAFMLAKAQAIGPDSLLELTKPPRLQALLERLKERDAKLAAEAQKNMQMGLTPEGKKAA